MKSNPRSPAGAALTDLVLDIFAANNRLLSAGDRLVNDLGLTSARWQVLGTVANAQRPQPVAWLARDMGANRQNVQRIVNDLAKAGLVTFEPNPHHRRALLVVLTAAGHTAYDAAMRLQAPWIDTLSIGLRVSDINAAHRLLRGLLVNLEAADAE